MEKPLINESDILKEIKELLSDRYAAEKIDMNSFLEFGEGFSLNMSSLEIVDFLLLLENTFNIIIDINDRYYTIGDAVKSIEKYLKEKK